MQVIGSEDVERMREESIAKGRVQANKEGEPPKYHAT
jgi:hypothetical protein